MPEQRTIYANTKVLTLWYPGQQFHTCNYDKQNCTSAQTELKVCVSINTTYFIQREARPYNTKWKLLLSVYAVHSDDSYYYRRTMRGRTYVRLLYLLPEQRTMCKRKRSHIEYVRFPGQQFQFPCNCDKQNCTILHISPDRKESMWLNKHNLSRSTPGRIVPTKRKLSQHSDHESWRAARFICRVLMFLISSKRNKCQWCSHNILETENSNTQ